MRGQVVSQPRIPSRANKQTGCVSAACRPSVVDGKSRRFYTRGMAKKRIAGVAAAVPAASNKPSPLVDTRVTVGEILDEQIATKLA